jgi:hypothetical protein
VTDLGMLPGHDMCFATSKDDRGEMVGYLSDSGTGDVTPFIWQSGAMTDPNVYVPPDSGWTLHFALGSDVGDVVGRARNANGPFRAFKLQSP